MSQGRNFSGLGEWFEVFRGGKQVDGDGKEHDGDAIIDRAVATFNPAEHEPPLVVGHPKDNAPSFGWIEGLKASIKHGVKVLLARSKQVVPEFEDMVKRGLFKKRSASFYADGRLRHVGFLGATPPAVKGLADIKFKEGGSIMGFEFSEHADPGEALHQKTLELLKNPPKGDHLGRPIGDNFTYRDAFDFAARENPELIREYLQTL